ncbi:MAG: heat-inducible transcription repressor HrcA, partial [Actinobacteria bacterium]|nr:heat-inducible transcription repressor HrcA [Actinomycetota bacterium]
MQLSSRKREILRHVVEEYVATGQPVGSRSLLERSKLSVSSSTVRGELAELETLGLLTQPHTSAGRLPTDSGYRLYTEELVEALEGRPDALGVDLRAMRDEVEDALRATTDMLSRATHLLALVSAPSLETATIRHVEVLALQPTSVMVVAITSTGGVTKRVFRLDGPVDQGLVSWASEYLNERLTGVRLGSSTARRRLEEPDLSPRERDFLGLLGSAILDARVDDGPQVFVGGAPGLLEETRAEELEATLRLLELLERR